MKRISIIIPVYNAEKYICECVESLYRQGLEETFFEVILINDGSTDKSMEIISSLIEKHSNLLLINQTNQGVSIARNNGLQKAQGEYVWFVDADDLIVDNCLPQLLDLTEKYNLDILKIGLAFFRHSPDEIMAETPAQNYVCKNGGTSFSEDYSPKQEFVFLYLYQREYLISNHLHFLEHISFCEDMHFTISAILPASRVIYYPIQVYLYRQHETSVVHTICCKYIHSLSLVTGQITRILKESRLDRKTKTKLKSCIVHLLALNYYYLARHSALYSRHQELIKELKSQVPFFFSYGSLRELTISIAHNCFPYLYVKLKHRLM